MEKYIHIFREQIIKSDLQELRAFKCPPKIVVNTAEYMLMLIGN